MRNVNEFDTIYEGKKGKFIVRLYDGFDNLWIDVSKSVSLEEAKNIWSEKTEKGTKNIEYGDIDYYNILPEDLKC